MTNDLHTNSDEGKYSDLIERLEKAEAANRWMIDPARYRPSSYDTSLLAEWQRHHPVVKALQAKE